MAGHEQNSHNRLREFSIAVVGAGFLATGLIGLGSTVAGAAQATRERIENYSPGQGNIGAATPSVSEGQLGESATDIGIHTLTSAGSILAGAECIAIYRRRQRSRKPASPAALPVVRLWGLNVEVSPYVFTGSETSSPTV